MITAAWADAIAIANGFSVTKGRRHQVRRAPDRLGWTVSEVGA